MNQPYGQPVHPQPGYPPPGYPAYGYPQSAPYPQPKAGGGKAITAGILALLQGLIFALAEAAMVSTYREFRQDEDYDSSKLPLDVVLLATIGLVAGFFLVGAILLFCRRAAGRFLVIAMATLVLLGGLAGVVGVLLSGVDKVDIVPFSIAIAVCLAFELSILGLAAAKSTGRWIRARHQPAGVPMAPQYPYY